MLSANQVRKKYIDFFISKGHKEIPSASLIPENDPTLLFVNSGMFPLVPYLLGESHPQGTRLVDSQKCIRTEDIEDIGDTTHHTFFEMLGNWSLGDYFKKEQLPWIFEFLTQELKLDPQKIYVSVYRGNEKLGIPKDTEAVAIWKEVYKQHGIEAQDIDWAERDGMQGGRIFYYDDKENWWSRTGVPKNMPVGEPGGPDSEIFYDLGENLQFHENSKYQDQPCNPSCSCGRFVEIGNSVFMQYLKTEQGFEPLKKQNIDFGGGLERLTMVTQGKTNTYETDLFMPLIEKIEKLSNKKYQDNLKAFRVIADHMRTASFILGDDKGLVPSNTDQGYIIRRLIRRSVRYGKQLGINEIFTFKIAEIVIDNYHDHYQELAKNKEFIINQLVQEEEKFAKTLEKGEKEFEQMSKDNKISGKEAFILFSTYGFPLELTQELAQEKDIKINLDEFATEMKKHQELSRQGAEHKFKGGLADSQEQTAKLHTATHLLLAALRQVLGPQVIQKGSNITAERLRFDFNHDHKMTPEQIQEVEKIVNSKIEANIPIKCEEIPIEEAKAQGAIGVFEDKYGEQVKVYSVNDFSKELCGGPHAKNTGELGKFIIKKEESSSAGIRRIKAILG